LLCFVGDAKDVTHDQEMSRNTEEDHPDWQLLQAAINLLDRLLADLSSRARLIRTSTKPSSRPIGS
jgi:hypothetical protein